MAKNEKFIEEMNKAIDYVPLVREIHDRVAIEQYNKGVDDCYECMYQSLDKIEERVKEQK